jgi:hypothetical protein
LRWSQEILDETEIAIEGILVKKADSDAKIKAVKSRNAMERAFPEALVTDYTSFTPSLVGLPDPEDAHVIAAALKTQASTIVTDNGKDFPDAIREKFNIEIKSADQFIADTIDLDPGKAVTAMRCMRKRFNNPQITPEELLKKMGKIGLIDTVNQLIDYLQNL